MESQYKNSEKDENAEIHDKKSNFKEIIFSYLRILIDLNQKKINSIEKQIEEKEKSVLSEKANFKIELRYLENEFQDLKYKKKTLIQVGKKISQKEKFLKDQKKIFHYLINYCYDYIFFDERSLEFTALTKETCLCYIDDSTGNFLREYLFNFGKFEVILRLCDTWFHDDSMQRNIVIRNKPKSELWLETEKEFKVDMSYVHPHVNQTGSPCFGGYKSHIAGYFNASKYFDILLILQKSFLSSFNPASVFPGAIGGQGRSDWQKLFTNRRFLVKEERI